LPHRGQRAKPQVTAFASSSGAVHARRWTYLYRAIDQHGQVVDVLLSGRRDLAAARRFFTRALRAGTVPAEVTTDRAPAYPRVLDELIRSRTSAVVTTYSPPTSPPAIGSTQHSTS
jgi:transposase, IS6 family